MFTTLELRRNDAGTVATLSLNRPDVRNAFNETTIAEITRAFHDLGADDRVRAIVLAANGSAFCAGADLNWMKQMAGYSPAENLADARRFGHLALPRLADTPDITIEMVRSEADPGGVSELAVPPVAPAVGWVNRVRLGRDYYVRVDSSDYSVDPVVIGRFVDVTAGLESVVVTAGGQPAARHDRCWATGRTITDPEHVAAAARLREAFQAPRREPAAGEVEVVSRTLSDYDAAFGVEIEVA